MNTLLGFTTYLHKKLTNAIHADSPGLYTSDKILYLNTINKVHSIGDVIDGCILNGLREPIVFSFILDKLSGYKVFCEPETIKYEKMAKSIMNFITF